MQITLYTAVAINAGYASAPARSLARIPRAGPLRPGQRVQLAELLAVVDAEDGVWRCHSAFECTAVCPSFVDPGRRIMNLRTQVVSLRLGRLFGKA
jgi:Fe-S oxidoreductase